MIIVRLFSGLGNQLFQYALGRQLALKTGQLLKYDVSFFKEDGLRKYMLDHFETVGEIATGEEINRLNGHLQSKGLGQRIYRKVEPRLPLTLRRYLKENECWDYDAGVLNVPGNVFLDGYWQSYRYFSKFPACVYDELRVKKNLYSITDADMYKEISGNSSAVSIHVRRGDYVSNKEIKDFMGVLPVDYYNKAINIIKKKVKQPFFYFFSDDLDWVRENFKGVDECRFVHLDGGSKDYLELELMSKCRHNIIANSTFSWWGAFLNRNPQKVVIVPQNWVTSAKYNQKIELHFPAWIKV